MSGVDVVAENVEIRLWDSQWVNVVNHAACYRDMYKAEAVATAVRMTERLMAENITHGFPPAAYNRAAMAELIRSADIVATALSNLIAAGRVDARYGSYVTELTAALANVGPQS